MLTHQFLRYQISKHRTETRSHFGFWRSCGSAGFLRACPWFCSGSEPRVTFGPQQRPSLSSGVQFWAATQRRRSADGPTGPEERSVSGRFELLLQKRKDKRFQKKYKNKTLQSSAQTFRTCSDVRLQSESTDARTGTRACAHTHTVFSNLLLNILLVSL